MNFRKIIAAVLSLAVIGSISESLAVFTPNHAITANAADDYTTGSYSSFSYNKYSDRIELTKYSGSEENITIPSEIDGLPVTAINDYTFSLCSRIVSVAIPETVTSIGKDIFSMCMKLSTVTVDENNRAFSSQDGILFNKDKSELICCPMGSKITEYTVPDTVKTISYHAFIQCSTIKSVTIPDSVKNIGASAFYNCSQLSEINIPDNIENIGYEAFHYTKWLDNKQTENPVVVTGKVLYDARTAKGSVTVPDGVKVIEESAFQSAAVTPVTLPESLEIIGTNAFRSCSDLTAITIPENVKQIGSGAFTSCKAFTSVTVPASVKSIGDEAFDFCFKLESITIENPSCEISENSAIISTAVVRGYDDSTAQAYAKSHNMIFESLGEAPEVPTVETVYGDANEDGDIGIADAVLILQSIANPDNYQLTEQGRLNSDVSNHGDGVTASDALVIQQVEAGTVAKEDLPL